MPTSRQQRGHADRPFDMLALLPRCKHGTRRDVTLELGLPDGFTRLLCEEERSLNQSSEIRRPSTPKDKRGRERLRSKRAGFYRPAELASAILTRFEQMEHESNGTPACSTYRNRTGLTCAAEFRGMKNRRIEDAITMWLAESFPNAESQVRDIASKWPDIVLAYERDDWADDIFVFVEAKPIWQRWITTGERTYAGATTDCFGRGTGNYCNNNIRQLVADRDKLLAEYTDQRDRHMLLALVFQRPGEMDERVIQAVGDGWEHRSRHILDLCNPERDDIGMTAMLFWPRTPLNVAGCHAHVGGVALP